MPTPLYTLAKTVTVGIWDNCDYVARVYPDKIIVISPYVKWANNNGSLAYSKESIRSTPAVNAILTELHDDCEDSAWGRIGHALNDPFLQGAG